MFKNILENNFLLRFLTSITLGPLVLYITYIGGNYFGILLLLVMIASFYEFFKIIITNKTVIKKSKIIWGVSGTIYILLAVNSIGTIRSLQIMPPFDIFTLLFAIWAFDIGAYLMGSFFGGPKLFPQISPKKTWSGLVGGILLSALIPFIYFVVKAYYYVGAASFFDNAKIREVVPFILMISAWSAIFGLVGQIGDLLESYFKRKFAVKDSGGILPGHGGVLDRLDSIFMAAIFIYIILWSAQ